MASETLETLLSADSTDSKPIYLEGKVVEAKDVEGIYLVQNPDLYFMIPLRAILGTTPENDGQVGVFVDPVAQVWKCSASRAEALVQRPNFRIDEENLTAPKEQIRDGDPSKWSTSSKAVLSAGQTLEGACKKFDGKCSGGGSFLNDCAHFLSDAFIDAGFSELNQSQICVEVRCNQDSTCDLGANLNHRVIRAKNLRCWFAEKASKTATSIGENSGFWATYQERASDGQGHVAIIDTNSGTYYGTGWYSDWRQEYYQW